jgi:DMSO/TMAO reductase YedYZ molybdopterin-dependent catalytic subunit
VLGLCTLSIVLIENTSRRDLLKLGAAGALSLALPRAAFAQEPAGPIVKPLPPEWFVNFGSNAEMRWDAARDQGYLIDPKRFFVRNHTRTPTIDAATWRLKVFGNAVRKPLELSYRQLEKLACDSETAFIECAGNGRSFFGTQQGTPASGTQWKLGAIGVAHWRGVRLRDVLERAGLRRTAVDVLAAGLDDEYVNGGVNHGHVRRPLPIGKALDDALIALEMNGKELPLDHGFPARLVVPGWVGIANIKWLGSIEVADSALSTPFNTTFYPGLTRQNVKSAFELGWDAQLAAGKRQVLHGRAWSGHAPIRKVDVSTDGGASWRRARLHGPNPRNAWVRWELPWTPTPGRHELLARATDRSGLTQPDTVEFNPAGYGFWAVVRHPVTAR